MVRTAYFCFLIGMFLPSLGNAQCEKTYNAINAVWEQFYEAFNSLDATLMADIHSEDLVRISGGKRIVNYDTYIENYRGRFEKARDEGVTNEISVRFFERINNGTAASERGVYKLVRRKKLSDPQTYYGEFHVILEKKKGEWKITMDYDNNYGNTIGEKEFMESHGLMDYQHFIND